METPGTPEVAAAGGGAPVARHRLRLLVSVVFLLLLLVLVDLIRIGLILPDLAEPTLTSASTIRIAAQGDTFLVSSTVTAMPGCSVPVTLAPGTDRCLVYSVHNPGSLPIIVTSISVAAVDAPGACPADHLDISRTTFSGELAVPAGGTVTAPGVLLALRPDAAEHDGCKGAVFSLEYTASARYGVIAP
jgi:hypothetical protein